MVQKARDARLLRALLALEPPKGVRPLAWRRYVSAKVAPLVRPVLADLGQPVDGPAAKPEDLTARPTRPRAEPARKGPERVRVTIRASLAAIIEHADPLLGDGLDERVDTLLAWALIDRPALRQPREDVVEAQA